MGRGLADRLSFYMSAAGLSQKELAHRAGVTEAAISRYLSGVREPRAITIAALAKGLGVTVNDLMGTPARGLDEAYQMVARNAKDIPDEQRRRLIKILLDV